MALAIPALMAGLGHDTDEPANDQNKDGDIDCIGLIAVGIIEPRNRGHDDRLEALRVGLHLMVAPRNGDILTQGLVGNLVVLPGGHDPRESRYDDNQREQDRKGRRELKTRLRPDCVRGHCKALPPD